jgi:hypothetical protein
MSQETEYNGPLTREQEHAIANTISKKAVDKLIGWQ